ncbi:MAG: SRPBCC domain-containing protein [Ferruginibacter sp.]
MKKVKFSININATKEKVWSTLWDDSTYRQWCFVFASDSHAVSDWIEGSKIKFIDGKGNGMFSIIEKKIPNQQMTFKHLGELKNGVEDKKDWAGAMENYFLNETNGITELNIEMDINE